MSLLNTLAKVTAPLGITLPGGEAAPEKGVDAAPGKSSAAPEPKPIPVPDHAGPDVDPSNFQKKKSGYVNFAGGPKKKHWPGPSKAAIELQEKMIGLFGKDNVVVENLNKMPDAVWDWSLECETKGRALLMDIGKVRYALTQTVEDGLPKFEWSNEKTPDISQIIDFDRAGRYMASLYDGSEVEMTNKEFGSPKDFSLRGVIDVVYTSNSERLKKFVNRLYDNVDSTKVYLRDGVEHLSFLKAGEDVLEGKTTIFSTDEMDFAIHEAFANGKRVISLRSEFFAEDEPIRFRDPGEDITYRVMIDKEFRGLLHLDWSEETNFRGEPVGVLKTAYYSATEAPNFFKAQAEKGLAYFKAGDRLKALKVGDKIPFAEGGSNETLVYCGDKVYQIWGSDGKVAISKLWGSKGMPLISQDGNIVSDMFAFDSDGDLFFAGKNLVEAIVDEKLSSMKGANPVEIHGIAKATPVKPGIFSGALGGALCDIGAFAAGFGLLKGYEHFVKDGEDANFLEAAGCFGAPAVGIYVTQVLLVAKNLVEGGIGMTWGQALPKSANLVGKNMVKGGIKGGALGIGVGLGVFGAATMVGLNPNNEWVQVGTGLTGAVLTGLTLAAEGVAAAGTAAALAAGAKVGACAMGGVAIGRAFDHTAGFMKVFDPTSDGTWSDAFAKDPWLIAPAVSGALLAPVTVMPGMAPFTMAPGAVVWGGHRLYEWYADPTQYATDMANLKAAPGRAQTIFEDNPELFTPQGIVASEIEWWKDSMGLTKPADSE